MTVHAFSYCRFQPSDLALFRTCFDYYRARRGWMDWRRRTDPDFDVLVIEDAVEVTLMSLVRSADGQYRAFDEEFEEVADAPSMRELLPQLGMMLPWSGPVARSAAVTGIVAR